MNKKPDLQSDFDRYVGMPGIAKGIALLKANGTPTEQLEDFVSMFAMDDVAYLEVRWLPEDPPRWVLVTKHFIIGSYHPTPERDISFRGHMEIMEGIRTFQSGYGADNVLALFAQHCIFEDTDCFTIHGNPAGLTYTWSLQTSRHNFASKPQCYEAS
jgi:hypothetical protein